MPIQITKRGSLPEKRVFELACTHCQTQFTCEASDMQASPDPRDTGVLMIACPLCKTLVWRGTR